VFSTGYRPPENDDMPDATVSAGPGGHSADEIVRVEIRVQERMIGRVHGLRVLLDRRGLVLRGFTRSYHAKQLVQHAVMDETAIPIAANEIVVSSLSPIPSSCRVAVYGGDS
jgi:hypothetical protein